MIEKQKIREWRERGFHDGAMRLPAPKRIPKASRAPYKQARELGERVTAASMWIRLAPAVQHDQMRVAQEMGQKDRPAPCVTCRWAAYCKENEMTCGVFRSYCGEESRGNPARVPDKTWKESWNDRY